jgi:predicted nucleic acid-binding protein
VTLLVDTSVWSLALRRDAASKVAEVMQLHDAVAGSDSIVTTGLVLQELLQGFSGAKAVVNILKRFQALPLLQPNRQDHVAAAEIRNQCRRSGVQIDTIDAVLIQLCGRYDLTLLTTDLDFTYAAPHVPFRLWRMDGDVAIHSLTGASASSKGWRISSIRVGPG